MKLRTLLLLLAALVLLPWSEPDAGGGRRARQKGRLGDAFRFVKKLKPRGAPRVSANNVLILLADDLGADQLAAYGIGSDLPTTPNLDALAAGGLLFRNAWANPLCSPTRALIQTGRYAFRTGVGFVVSPTGAALESSELTLPEMLDLGTSQTYAHAAFGKWHLGNGMNGGIVAPNQAGYSHFSGTMTSIAAPDTYFDWRQVVDGVEARQTRYETEVVVDETLSWIGAQTGPWFCYLAFNLPHDPFHRPPDTLHTVDFTNVNPDPKMEPRPYYRAMVEAMDHEIGRLLAGIDPVVLAQTTVIFLGDNGTPKEVVVPPQQTSHAKGSVYEGGVHVPLIVSGPLVQMPGSQCDALVHAVDLYGTVAEIAGVDLAAQAPGITFDTLSLVPYFADPARVPLRDVLYAEVFYPNGGPPTGGLPHLCERPAGPALPPLYGNLPAQPWTCQEDIGFAGPGTAQLSICGQELSETGTATLTIHGPPNASGFLFSSLGFNPMPLYGGTIAPAVVPWLNVQVILTGPAGVYTEQVDHFPGAEYLYYQAVLMDPSQPAGRAVTNALRTRMFSQHGAIRNQRFKLVFDTYACTESLYDLSVDPLELNDLLLGPLGMTEQQNYDLLKAELAQIQ